MTTRFRPGDRVRLRPGRVAEWCGPRVDLRALVAARVGTVLAMGAAVDNGRGLYVRWDGNATFRRVWDEWLEPAAANVDDWGVGPATSG